MNNEQDRSSIGRPCELRQIRILKRNKVHACTRKHRESLCTGGRYRQRRRLSNSQAPWCKRLGGTALRCGLPKLWNLQDGFAPPPGTGTRTYKYKKSPGQAVYSTSMIVHSKSKHEDFQEKTRDRFYAISDQLSLASKRLRCGTVWSALHCG